MTTMSKKVAIINGITRMIKYNAHLATRYKEIGFTTKEYKFNPALLFCCHLHSHLDAEIKQIVDNSDVIHCQSSGFFRILPVSNHYYAFECYKACKIPNQQSNKPTNHLFKLILQSFDTIYNK